MSNAKKSIDGLVPRGRQSSHRIAVASDHRASKSSRAPQSNSIKVAGTQKSQKAKAKKTITQTDPYSDFLQPIHTFDMDSDEIAKDLGKRRRQDKKSKKQLKKSKKGKKLSKKRKIIIAILSVIFLLLLGFAIWLHFYINNLTNGNSGLFDSIGSLWSDGAELKTDENGRTNVLVFGTSGYEMDGSGHDGAQLTDSIMIVSLDQENEDVATISIPRDLKVSMACSAGKINEVYWCNNQSGDDESAGAQALEEQVEEVLGISIQYAVHVDWGALVQVVDTLGGITVTLDEDINDSWTKTYIQAGVPTTLNGEQALGLARARHGTSNGDFSRGNSQQKILLAIQQKAVEQGIDLSSALSIVSTLGDNVRMDFTTDELKTVYNIAQDFNMENMRSIQLVDSDNGINLLTTGTINGVSYVLPTLGYNKYTDIHEYIAQQLNSDSAVREGAEILILNGSGQSGVASTEQTKLENDGLTVADIGDAPTGNYEGYQVYIIDESMTATKSKLAEYYSVEVQSASALPRGINTNGYDFVIIVGTQASEE